MHFYHFYGWLFAVGFLYYSATLDVHFEILKVRNMQMNFLYIFFCYKKEKLAHRSESKITINPSD